MRSQININLLPLSYVIIFTLIFSFLAKPISTIFVKTNDVRCELFDDFEKNETTEKEMSSDFEYEEHSIFYINFMAMEFNVGFINNYNNTQTCILNFNPNIHLPPPKL